MKIGKKAFTLIELMIVVVILGVLMSTVLPKLTGAQARSRDAGRIADISNIASALQVYYDDNGQYPTASGACLSTGSGVAALLKGYMQSEKVPQDPQPTANKHFCSSTVGENTGLGRYYYAAVTKNGLERNAYLLCADMETLQKANTEATDVAATAASGGNNANAVTAYSTLQPLIGSSTNLTTEPNGNAGESVYCILRP